MIQWTDSAEQYLKEHFYKSADSIRKSGADPLEVQEDLRRHIEEQVRSKSSTVVSREDQGAALRYARRADQARTEVVATGGAEDVLRHRACVRGLERLVRVTRGGRGRWCHHSPRRKARNVANTNRTAATYQGPPIAIMIAPPTMLNPASMVPRIPASGFSWG